MSFDQPSSLVLTHIATSDSARRLTWMGTRADFVLVDRHDRGPREAALRGALAGRVDHGTIDVVSEVPSRAGIVLAYQDPRGETVDPRGLYILAEPGTTPVGDLHVTGAHVASLLLAGARGVIDVRALPMPETVDAIERHHRAEHAGRSLLVGDPYERVQALITMVIEDWPTDDYGDLDGVCFRAAMALAQLPTLRPQQFSRRNFGYKAFAAGLNAQVNRTGFVYNVATLQRVLSRLGRFWAPAEELWADGVDEVIDVTREPPGLEDEARTMLPDLARQHGFPRIPPTQSGLAPDELHRRIYDLLTRLSLANPFQTVAGYPYVVANVPPRPSRHNRRSS